MLKVAVGLLAFLCFLTAEKATSERQQGRQSINIRPLESTREDVQAMFGKSTESECSECFYNAPDKQLRVSYSNMPCKGGVIDGWNVPAGTVINYTVYFRDNPPQIDLRTFKEGSVVSLSPGTFVLQEEGVVYTVSELDKTVKSISFLPKEVDNKKRCEGYPSYNPAGAMYTPAASFRQEDALSTLDVLVAESQVQSTEFVVYVVIYGPKEISDAAYNTILNRYRQHLYKRRKASPKRIHVVAGGRRDSFAANVYRLRVDDPAPVPSPDYVRRPTNP